MNAREKLHRLADRMPEEDAEATVRYAEGLLAGVDREPLSSREILALAKGKAAVRRGEVRNWKEARKELE